MKFDLYMQKTSNLFAENRLLKFTIAVMAIVVMFAFYYVDKKIQNQRIVLIPPNIHSRIIITGDKPDAAYIKQFTRYIVSLALDYTSANARGQFDELLSLYNPKNYNAARTMFYNLADSVESISNLSNMFAINKIKIFTSKIIVMGREKTFVGDKLQSNKVNTYIINYQFKNGKFTINSIKKKENNA